MESRSRNWSPSAERIQRSNLASFQKERGLGSYEELHADPRKALREVLGFLHVSDVGDALVNDAVEFSRFDNMKKLEQQRRFASSRMQPGRDGSREGRKVRRGKVGGYVDHLSREDVAYCNRLIAELGCPFVSVELS